MKTIRNESCPSVSHKHELEILPVLSNKSLYVLSIKTNKENIFLLILEE